MNRLRPSLLFAVCLLALFGAATAGATEPTLKASFTTSPSNPAPGQDVTFTSTSTGAPDSTLWDLDNDGAFDDGAGTKAHQSYDVGVHIVRLKVRKGLVGATEDIEAKTVIVAAGPAATPTPTVTAPVLNLPPTARISRECAPVGPATVCLGPVVKLDVPKTFDGRESSDADGQIVRYQWDLDGNGTYEIDGGAQPTITRTLRDEKPVVIKLRVTDDDGATDETSMALKKLEPACTSQVMYERVVATSPCLRRYEISDGTPLLLPNGGTTPSVSLNGQQYRSEFPVSVNGVTIAPADGKQVLVNVLGAGLLRTLEIVSGNATATFPVKGEHIRLRQGSLRFTLENNELRNVGSLNGQTLNGLKLSGAPDTLELPTRGVSRVSAFLALPATFGSVTSDRLTLTAGTPVADVTGGVARKSAADGAFEFTVPNAAIGPIGLDELLVRYDGAGFWQIEANVGLPEPIGATIEGKAGILNGAFNYAGAELNFGTPGIGPFGPLFIQRIKFRVEVAPKVSECVPHLGVEKLQYPWGDVTTDYGVPTFALCGEIGLTAGPTVLGAKIISIDGGLGFATYDDRPDVLRAFGDLKVVDIPFAHAEFEAHTDGFVKVSGKFDYGWSGFASVSGYIDLGVLGSKFNAEGGVKACLEFVDFCRGVNALISSKGMAVCMVIDYEIDDWRPGFGYRWGDALPDAYFSGCSLAPYRETITRPSASSVGERSVDLPAGLPGTAFAATAAGGAPSLTLIGPKGERIELSGDVLESKGVLGLKNRNAKLSQIAVARPSAGRWRVVSDLPLTSLKVAHGLEAPKVEATVSGSGQRRTLRYSVEQRPGQVVSFIERGPSTSGLIGTARGASGELAFAPAGGAAEKREIVAVVEQDGMTREQIVVARYGAPAVRKPGRVRGLQTQRRGSTLTVRFTPAARAADHVVTVALSDGRRVVRKVGGRSLVVRGVARRTRATKIAVRGVTANGVLGPITRR